MSCRTERIVKAVPTPADNPSEGHSILRPLHLVFLSTSMRMEEDIMPTKQDRIHYPMTRYVGFRPHPAIDRAAHAVLMHAGAVWIPLR